MRRIERLINLIAALLEASRPMTAEEIRTRIAGYSGGNAEAFRRRFERDKEALRAVGIPLEVVPTDPFADQADGYVISKERYYLPHLDLEPDELAALHIAAQALLGGHEEAEAGLLKLSVEVEEAPVLGPRRAWGAEIQSQEPNLLALYAALLERKPVRFDYQASGDATPAPRTVEIYGLVHRGGRWYLVGRDRDRADVRSFRLTRMSSGVQTLEGTYGIPEGFDAGAHLREAWELGGEAPQKAVVRFDPGFRWWAEQNFPDATTRPTPDGGVDLELDVSNIDGLISWVLGLGDQVELVAPDDARARLVEHLEPLLGSR